MVDRDKQKAVILFALDRAGPEPPQLRPGRTRLWLRAFLFLVDMESYAHLGASITGARYRRGVKAPIVEGLTRSLRELEADGSIARG